MGGKLEMVDEAKENTCGNSPSLTYAIFLNYLRVKTPKWWIQR